MTNHPHFPFLQLFLKIFSREEDSVFEQSSQLILSGFNPQASSVLLPAIHILTLSFFTQMPAILYEILRKIDNCSSLNSLKQTQTQIIIHGLHTNNLLSVKLITFSSQIFNQIDYARLIFNNLLNSANVYLWTAMISSYSNHQNSKFSREAIVIYRMMLRHGTNPNSFTLSTVLKACSILKYIIEGKQIQSYSIKHGFSSFIYVQTSLLDMYSKLFLVEESRCLFDNMVDKNIVACNVMMSCYVKNSEIESARVIFDQMYHTDSISAATMIYGYAKNGAFEDARKLFDRMPVKEIASWNAVITGYCDGGLWIQCIKFFNEMQLNSIKPNHATIAMLLSCSAQLGALRLGRQLHALLFKFCSLMNVYVSNSLVSMYAKCGSLQEASCMFFDMPEKDIVSYNALITGLVNNGFGEKALNLFEELIQKGIQPDTVTFMGILTACSQIGSLDLSLNCFEFMRNHHAIEPSADHYASIVDLLGRKGLVEKAYDLIKSMKVEPHGGVWGALLHGCCGQSNVEIGRVAAEELFRIEPENSGNYVILSNIYARFDFWDDVREIRGFMRGKGVAKTKGCSWIEVEDEVFEFVMGEKGHFFCEEIFVLLRQLSLQIMLLNWEPY